jgi:hypothetical protein
VHFDGHDPAVDAFQNGTGNECEHDAFSFGNPDVGMVGRRS